VHKISAHESQSINIYLTKNFESTNAYFDKYFNNKLSLEGAVNLIFVLISLSVCCRYIDLHVAKPLTFPK